MNGNKFGIMVYLGVDHDSRWLYTWLIQLVERLNKSGLHKSAMHFYISMLSPCAPTVVSFCKDLNLSYSTIAKPEVLTRFGGVASELKTHHLSTMLDSKVIVLSQDFDYDVYLDSLIKSFKPLVLVVPTQGQVYSNAQLMQIKDSLI